MTRLGFHLRRQWPSVILIGVLLILVVNAIWGPLSPRDLLILRRERVNLTAQHQTLLDRNLSLRTSIQNLRSNDRYLQHLIRRELGYTGPDELIYKFTDDQQPQQH